MSSCSRSTWCWSHCRYDSNSVVASSVRSRRSAVRAAYPVRAPGSGSSQALRGKWFDTDDDLWSWLDRDRDRLHGPDLAGQLEWCEAGQRLRVDWTADILVFRPAEVDADVQREESRLVDVEALKEFRAGLGESYRRALVEILKPVPEGLTFKELVDALRERQGHDVHSTFLPPGVPPNPESRLSYIQDRLAALAGELRIRRLRCPNCGARTTIPIRYGLPGEEMANAAARGEITLGGCIVTPQNPDSHCTTCGYSWQALGPYIGVEGWKNGARLPD